MRAYHYNPAELEAPEYRRVEAAVIALGEVASSDETFMTGFREIWKNGPFSHVTINVAQQTAEELANYLDTIRVGGGAFAVRPLVSHLLTKPLDAGVFVSQPWNAVHQREPNRADMEAVERWEGWSIKSFWTDVQTNPVTRISFSPAEPVFDGPVYVLTSKRTASAAELATDALRSANRAIIIGENTGGEMLSQKIYDVPGGFHLSLPIADYFSVVNGRIEGVGIKPDIETDAADAFDVALKQL